jgi:hypothetical protein
LKGSSNEKYKNVGNIIIVSGFFDGNGVGGAAFDSRAAGANRSAYDAEPASYR